MRSPGVPFRIEARSNCKKAVERGKCSGKYRCSVTTQTWKLPKIAKNNNGGGTNGDGNNNGNTKS